MRSLEKVGMQKITRIVAVLLVVIALGLAFIAFSVGKRTAPPVAAGSPEASGGQTQHVVVVAAQDLSTGQRLTADLLRTVQMASPPAGAYAQAEQLNGQVVVRTVAAGAPVLQSALAQGIGATLNAGERAIAVPVDELAGVGNRVSPGSYVDVFMNLSASRGSEGRDSQQTRLLLSRIRVLAYGNQDLGQPEGSEAQAAASKAPPAQAPNSARAAAIDQRNSDDPSSRGKTAIARSAVLAVPVEQASSLLLAAQTGKLFLALRSPIDDGVADADLFPLPRRVLTARATLSEEQKQAVELPENAAFAGIDSQALSGTGPSVPRTAPARASNPAVHSVRSGGIEVIRGDGRTAQPTTL